MINRWRNKTENSEYGKKYAQVQPLVPTVSDAKQKKHAVFL